MPGEFAPKFAAALAAVPEEVDQLLDGQQRQLLAVSGARQLGYGGIKLMAEATGASIDTVSAEPRN